MNIGGLVRAIERQGEVITIRRATGAARTPFDVKVRAWVQVGVATILIGGVQTTADQIWLTSLELEAARWPHEPRHGDTIIYHDGRTAMVQGRARTTKFNDDTGYVLTVLGAQ